METGAVEFHDIPGRQKDIIELYGILPEKITVAYHGLPTMSHNMSEPFFFFPYILYVGARWNYKNFVPFIKEFAKVSNDYPDIHLVCTWKPFNESEKKLISELKIQNKVHHFSPSFKQFHSLYHNAIAFVFPSMYEGFGLPILEAFSCGCPVILNDASCFPEVAGDAALYVKFDERNNNFHDVFKYVWELSTDDRLH